jgi:L-malate glycosyltransferase
LREKLLRILVIHPYSETIDGTGSVVSGLIEHMDRNNYEFVAAAPAEGYFTSRMKQLDVRYYTFPMAAIKRTYNPFKILGFLFRWHGSIRKVAEIISTQRIDLVVSNTSQVLFAGIAAKKLGVPHISYLHEVSFSKPAFIGKIVTGLISKNASKIIVVSEFIRKTFLELNQKAADKIEVVPNGLDLEPFVKGANRAEFRKEFDIRADEFAFGILGRVCKRKGQEAFLRAAEIVNKEVPLCKFLIIGEPTSSVEKDYKRSLEKLIVQRNISNVIFTGLRRDVKNVIAGLDCVVISSEQESFSMVALEAMALSKPIASFEVGGVPERVKNNFNGLMVPEGDFNALAGAMVSLARDPGKAVVLGKNGFERLKEEFLIDKTIRKMDDIWQRAIR